MSECNTNYILAYKQSYESLYFIVVLGYINGGSGETLL